MTKAQKEASRILKEWGKYSAIEMKKHCQQDARNLTNKNGKVIPRGSYPADAYFDMKPVIKLMKMAKDAERKKILDYLREYFTDGETIADIIEAKCK